ncbi:MAG TPA: histone deacetylase, partial [Thermoanaerobaculia bacterium]|nr:histone deacetylase [Thermoanaerobaculia bacterium]
MKIYTASVFYRHDTGFDHPEHPRRLDAAIEGLARAGLGGALIRDADAHPDTARIIHKVHSADYERDLQHAVTSGQRYFHTIDNPISSASFAAARAAVASSLAAIADLWDREDAKRAFVIARPPGHHAERAHAMGFCFFNTIACVAEWLRERPGVERVFIYDFDVHH